MARSSDGDTMTMSRDDVKGLDVARQFFGEWGLPYLRSEFPEISERIAAFLCGGSQSLGNDDEASRDHGWGPGFGMVLTGEDMKRYGQKLRNRLKEDAPNNWHGYRWRTEANVPVDSINPWFKSNIGCSHPPGSADAWLDRTREINLYMLRDATIFHDPLGEFTARRRSFHVYPDRAWLRVRNK